MSEPEVSVAPAAGAAGLAEVRRLFRAYAAWLPNDLCLQDFEAELAALPGDYAEPAGGLWLAQRGRAALGVVALRPLAAEAAAEIKRLYVLPEARGRALGRRLLETCVQGARTRGYAELRLETMKGHMEAAERLYLDAGFRDCTAYSGAPHPDLRYLSLKL